MNLRTHALQLQSTVRHKVRHALRPFKSCPKSIQLLFSGVRQTPATWTAYSAPPVKPPQSRHSYRLTVSTDSTAWRPTAIVSWRPRSTITDSYISPLMQLQIQKFPRHQLLS